jgi:hypothetical protein
VLKHLAQQSSLRGSKDLCIYCFAVNRHEAEVDMESILRTILKDVKRTKTTSGKNTASDTPMSLTGCERTPFLILPFLRERGLI